MFSKYVKTMIDKKPQDKYGSSYPFELDITLFMIKSMPKLNTVLGKAKAIKEIIFLNDIFNIGSLLC